MVLISMASAALRQQPGLACESCRKKKSRCDRARPECGSCTVLGAVCIYTDKRPQRGPRKGQLKALRARVATLERCLGDQSEYVDLDHCTFFGPLTPVESSIDASSVTTSPEKTRKPSVIQSLEGEYVYSNHSLIPDPRYNTILNATESTKSNRRLNDLDHGIFPDLLLPIDQTAAFSTTDQSPDEESPDRSDTTFIPGSTVVNSSTQPNEQPWSNPRIPETAPYNKGVNAVDEIGDLIQADLDQLYFDRVHPITPLVCRTRYFSWAFNTDKKEAQAALQSAVRALAASASAAYQELANSLYVETCRRLAKLDEATDHDFSEGFQLEHVQAWLLLAHYEFTRKPYRRAMMTAGRAFRMIQVSLLPEIHERDIPPDGFDAGSNGCWVEEEEKRRTFWVAYCLDRCAGLYDGSPLTFHEDGMHIRLPASEGDFESGRPILMDFLHDAIAISGQNTLSPFAECVVILTIGGRCISHRPRALTESLYGHDLLEFWARYEWLDTTLDKRRRHLARISPSLSTLSDPMLILTHLISATVMIHLMEILKSRYLPTAQHRVTVDAYEDRISHAAREIASLARSVTQLSCFKAHLFIPCALFHGVRILSSRLKNSDAAEVIGLLKTLQDLEGVNNMAQNLMRKLELGGIFKPCLSSEGIPNFPHN
ncbi:fungal-specific transcription factor domain-containing protein [Rostrohypoxylon terebratum]|nr:fungal-specific transcription factor domain-containing protein [Rostrohypoxylon terebratum]